MMLSRRDIDILTAGDEQDSSYVVVKDGCFDDIIDQIFDEVQLLRGRCRPAQMSRGDQTWQDEYIRGDSLCWITTSLIQELSLSGLAEFIERMIRECDVLKSHLRLSSDYSIQFALYPGKGEGYNRHKDAFPVDPSSSGPSLESTRQLTCLLYLNRDWTPADGGQLRVFTLPGVEMEGCGKPFSFWGVNGYDIDPHFGRLVVFRSTEVSHAVLPCFHGRAALTLWIEGAGSQCSDKLTSGLSGNSKSVFMFSAESIQPDNS